MMSTPTAKSRRTQIISRLIWPLLASSGLALFPIHANAQGVEVAAGTVVASGALRELAQDAQELANTVQSQATLTSFNVRSDLIILAENLKKMADAFEGKLVKDLTKSEQKLIADLRVTLGEAKEGGEAMLAKAEQVVLTAGQEASRIPGVADTPFVTSIRPAFAVVDVRGKDETIELVASGSLLGRGTQSLHFNGKPCQTLSATERDVRFRCTVNDLWSTQKSSVWATGTIVVERSAEWWAVWKPSERSTYPAAVRRIDKVLGMVSVRATVSETVLTRVARSEERVIRSEPCQKQSATWAFNPASACSIDVTTVNAVPGPVSSWSRFNGVQTKSESGFVVTGTSVGSGRKVLGECVGGGKGVVIARASWTDVCSTTVQRTITIKEKTPLTWGSDLVVELPRDHDGFLISVLQSNGAERSLTTAGISDWFVVDHDAVANRVIVRSKPLEQAFR